MKNLFKKILVCLLVSAMVLSFAACAGKTGVVIKKEVNTLAGELSGKTVILHSNDVHGAIEGYSYMAALKDAYEEKGATVIVVDAGDFMQGSIYVSESHGVSAINLMNLAGYDIASLGNHDLDYGCDELIYDMLNADFVPLCSNVTKDGEAVFVENAIVKVGKLKIGFFGLLTPQAQTKTLPSNVEGLDFASGDNLVAVAQKETDLLNKKCDLVICLSHLGVESESYKDTSSDIWNGVTGLDFIIDAHSHTVMEQGENGEKIQQTGTKFSNIGCIVIDNATKTIEDNYLVSTEGLEQDPEVLAAAQEYIEDVDKKYGEVFAHSFYLLHGEKAEVRTGETNLGDLVADAILWYVTYNTALNVDEDNVVAVINGGCIRSSVQAGDISSSDIQTVLPFENTVVVDYVTGAELLEALEASCFACPEPLGGFPQISSLNIQIDTTVEYDAGDLYPGSTYYAPASINRVSILDINGKAFDENATYAVVTCNFCAEGGDTYYAFKRAYDSGTGFDTSFLVSDVVVEYIKTALNGNINVEYAEAAGRITIVK